MGLPILPSPHSSLLTPHWFYWPTVIVVGLTGWNGLLELEPPSSVGGVPIIRALGYLGKLPGPGNALTPLVDPKPGRVSRRKKLEKVSLPVCVAMAGETARLLTSIGLFWMLAGAAPPSGVVVSPVWARAVAEIVATPIAANAQVAMRMI